MRNVGRCCYCKATIWLLPVCGVGCDHRGDCRRPQRKGA